MAVQALAGFLSVNNAGGAAPVVPGVPAADLAAGLTGLSAVLMALIGREQTGQGDYVDIAMFDSLLPWCAHIAGSALAGGDAPRSDGQRSLGGAAFYNVYVCADGRHVVLGGREEKFATALLTALGRPDLIPLSQAEAGPEQAPLIAYLRETFRSRTRAAWEAYMDTLDVAFAPVLDFAEAFAQPHIAERGLLISADGRPQIAPAIRFAGDDWQPGPVPELGGG
jgi:crotonobetainyl-CoA:carnitine CoA-transferase CaiB-like acyl-CoA transferase